MNLNEFTIDKTKFLPLIYKYNNTLLSMNNIIIKQIIKSSGKKMVTIPAKTDMQVGDYVLIRPLEIKQMDENKLN